MKNKENGTDTPLWLVHDGDGEGSDFSLSRFFPTLDVSFACLTRLLCSGDKTNDQVY